MASRTSSLSTSGQPDSPSRHTRSSVDSSSNSKSPRNAPDSKSNSRNNSQQSDSSRSSRVRAPSAVKGVKGGKHPALGGKQPLIIAPIDVHPGDIIAFDDQDEDGSIETTKMVAVAEFGDQGFIAVQVVPYESRAADDELIVECRKVRDSDGDNDNATDDPDNELEVYPGGGDGPGPWEEGDHLQLDRVTFIDHGSDSLNSDIAGNLGTLTEDSLTKVQEAYSRVHGRFAPKSKVKKATATPAKSTKASTASAPANNPGTSPTSTAAISNIPAPSSKKASAASRKGTAGTDRFFDDDRPAQPGKPRYFWNEAGELRWECRHVADATNDDETRQYPDCKDDCNHKCCKGGLGAPPTGMQRHDQDYNPMPSGARIKKSANAKAAAAPGTAVKTKAKAKPKSKPAAKSTRVDDLGEDSHSEAEEADDDEDDAEARRHKSLSFEAESSSDEKLQSTLGRGAKPAAAISKNAAGGSLNPASRKSSDSSDTKKRTRSDDDEVQDERPAKKVDPATQDSAKRSSRDAGASGVGRKRSSH